MFFHPGTHASPDRIVSLEEDLTVAYCRACNRTGHLSAAGTGYWCSWCAGAAEIELRPVRTVTKETADRFTTDGQLLDPENVPLQPLRITAGWKVHYNNGLYEVDPTPSTIPWWWIFKCDMMTLVHEEKNRLLDLSWSDEMNVEEGCYRLTLYEGTDYHGTELETYETRDRQELVERIETILQVTTNRAR